MKVSKCFELRSSLLTPCSTVECIKSRLCDHYTLCTNRRGYVIITYVQCIFLQFYKMESEYDSNVPAYFSLRDKESTSTTQCEDKHFLHLSHFPTQYKHKQHCDRERERVRDGNESLSGSFPLISFFSAFSIVQSSNFV